MSELVSKENQTKQVAALALGGASQQDIADQLKITIWAVRKIQKSSEYKDIMKREADEQVNAAKNLYRAQLVGLTDKALRVMKRLLDSPSTKDNIEGVKLFYRGIGLDAEEQQQGDTNLVINLPGKTEQVINVDHTSKGVEEDDSI